MPSWPAIRRAVASLSPVSMTTCDPELVQRGDRGGGGVPRARRRCAISPAGAAVDGDEHRGAPGSRPARSRRAASAPEVDALALEQAAVADGDPVAVDAGDRAVAGDVLEPGGGQPLGPAGLGVRGRSPGPAGARTRARPRRPARSSSASSMPSATTSVTSGSPLVRVPVLSITTVSIRAEVSSAVAFLNSTPRRAPSPVPTMIAVGVARPSASGQVMTTTVIANSSAVVHRPVASQQPRGEGQRRRRAGRRAPARTRPGRPAAARGPWSSAPAGPA